MAAPAAPNKSTSERIVLFDGVCQLCSLWVKFLLRFDRKQRFKLAAMQSPQGQVILTRHALPTQHFDTMLLVEGSRIYTRSTAFLRVMAQLPLPWPLACVGWIIPRALRDALYNLVARNRYTLFGRTERCLVIDPTQAERFVEHPAPHSGHSKAHGG